MAENTVTIKLRLDPSDFNSGLKGIQKQIQSVSAVNVIGKSGASSSKVNSVASSVIKMDSAMGGFSKTLATITSMFRGNMSSFNVLGAGKGISQMVSGAGAAGGAAVGAGASVAAIVAIPIILTAIAVGVAALMVSMEAIEFGTKPVVKILGIIGKILGAALIPISLIFVELLKPLIWIMLPFVKMLMMLLLPFRKFLSERMVADKEEIQGLASAGDFNAVSLIMSENIGQSIGYLFQPAFIAVIDSISGLRTAFITQLGIFARVVGETLIDVAPFLTDADRLSFKNKLNLFIADTVGDALTSAKVFDEGLKETYNSIITNDGKTTPITTPITSTSTSFESNRVGEEFERLSGINLTIQGDVIGSETQAELFAEKFESAMQSRIFGRFKSSGD